MLSGASENPHCCLSLLPRFLRGRPSITGLLGLRPQSWRSDRSLGICRQGGRTDCDSRTFFATPPGVRAGDGEEEGGRLRALFISGRAD